MTLFLQRGSLIPDHFAFDFPSASVKEQWHNTHHTVTASVLCGKDPRLSKWLVAAPNAKRGWDSPSGEREEPVMEHWADAALTPFLVSFSRTWLWPSAITAQSPPKQHELLDLQDNYLISTGLEKGAKRLIYTKGFTESLRIYLLVSD